MARWVSIDPWRKGQKLAALAVSTLLFLGAVAALLPIPGPRADEVCDAHLSNDRTQLRSVVSGLRYSDMTLWERFHEATSSPVARTDCVAHEFDNRREVTRFCRITPPTTEVERNVRELLFKKVFLESYLACLADGERELP